MIVMPTGTDKYVVLIQLARLVCCHLKKKPEQSYFNLICLKITYCFMPIISHSNMQRCTVLESISDDLSVQRTEHGEGSGFPVQEKLVSYVQITTMQTPFHHSNNTQTLLPVPHTQNKSSRLETGPHIFISSMKSMLLLIWGDIDFRKILNLTPTSFHI